MRLNIVLIVFCLLLTNCAVQIRPQAVEKPPVSISNETPSIETENYSAKLKSIQTERQNLFTEYRQAAGKNAILEKARQSFVTSIDNEIFPAWYGTDWDFYGTTETPKSGKIACGYFVTTVLRDAGVRVQRVSLAQQASENIIKSLTNAAFIKRFHNAPIEKFVEETKKFGPGLYIVGLDVHVGFILHDGADIWFIHSSYAEPSEVIKEKALESPILSSSKYRVLGKISADDQFILKWLNQTSIPTYRR
jgi:hypothetical protein